MRAAPRIPDRQTAAPPDALRVRARARLATLVAVALLPLLPPNLSAADPEAVSRDAMLTLKARKALRQEETLAPLNLGVRVRGGAATLWGRVPSESLAAKAVEQVRQVPGISAVRSELAVVPRDGDLPDVIPAPPAVPPAYVPPDPEKAPPPSASLAGRAAGHGPAPGQPLAGGNSAPEAGGPAAPLRSAISVMPPVAMPRPPPASAAGPVLLLPPVASGASPADSSGASSPEAGKAAESPSHLAELSAAVERLRQSDPRFRGVRPEIRERTVYLRGTVARAADVMDLATAVSRLPGVERVVVGTSEAAPSPSPTPPRQR
jgi:BON domain